MNEPASHASDATLPPNPTEPGARRDEATTWIEPVMLACLEDKKFFEELAPDVRSLVTLWVLSAQVHRKGVAHFVEDEPDWLVLDSARAAESIGDTALAALLTPLLPALKRGRKKARLSAKGVDWSVHDGVDPLVKRVRDGKTLEARVVDGVLSARSAFGAVRARAETIHAAALEVRKRAADVAQEKAAAKARSRFDALRERARPWSKEARFKAEDVVHHAKFGLGHVRAVVSPNKIEVEFEDGPVRTLLHATP